MHLLLAGCPDDEVARPYYILNQATATHRLLCSRSRIHGDRLRDTLHATTVADNITVRPPAIFYRGRSPVYLGLQPEIIEPPRKITDDEPILVLATIG